MLNVSDIILDPDFVQTFTVHRKAGVWEGGRFKQTETSIKFQGTVTAAKAKDIEQVPEGDRPSGIMCFHTTAEIYVTRQGTTEGVGTSDEIGWRGQRYRIFNVYPWVDFGYYKAIGIRMGGS